jgi:hypothetical protein
MHWQRVITMAAPKASMLAREDFEDGGRREADLNQYWCSRPRGLSGRRRHSSSAPLPAAAAAAPGRAAALRHLDAAAAAPAAAAAHGSRCCQLPPPPLLLLLLRLLPRGRLRRLWLPLRRCLRCLQLAASAIAASRPLPPPADALCVAAQKHSA